MKMFFAKSSSKLSTVIFWLIRFYYRGVEMTLDKMLKWRIACLWFGVHFNLNESIGINCILFCRFTQPQKFSNFQHSRNCYNQQIESLPPVGIGLEKSAVKLHFRKQKIPEPVMVISAAVRKAYWKPERLST